MTFRQALREAELKCNIYAALLLKETSEYYQLKYLEQLAWYSARRRFYLRCLIRQQLRDFDHA